MNALIELACRWIAVYRLTKLITSDEITQPVRDRIGQWAEGHEHGSLPERIDYAVNCGECSSVWASGIVVGLCTFPAGRFVVKALAGSGAALVLHAAVQRIDR